MANPHPASHQEPHAKANVEETDVSFALIAIFFAVCALFVILSGGITWGMWTYFAAQANVTGKSDYTLANQQREEMLKKYPQRDANGFYYERLQHSIPAGPGLEGLTSAADLDHAVMSGNLGWPSEGAIQRRQQEEILNGKSADGKEGLTIGAIMKQLAPTLPVRESNPAKDKTLQDYYQAPTASSSGRSVVRPEGSSPEVPMPRPPRGAKP
jgi:hypothetical protein